jgi:hypothetical protein
MSSEPTLHRTAVWRCGTGQLLHRDPETEASEADPAATHVPGHQRADARRTCATLLVDLDVHPQVIMQILRPARIKVTMEIYSQAPAHQTREALRRLSESLDS